MLIQMKAYIFHFFFFAELPVGYPFLTHVFPSFLFPLYHEKSRHSLLSVYFHFTGATRFACASFFICLPRQEAAYLWARTLLASAISWKIPACFLAMIALMASSVATISATAMMRQMTTFWIRPARMKLTKATAETVRA